MNRRVLHQIVCDWIVPGAIGLAGAAVVISGAEIGGVLGWLLITVAAAALACVVMWAVRTVYSDDWMDDNA